MSTDARDAAAHSWAALPSPMQRALELAWESAAAGSFGIGAVVVDATGAVVATGRNRILEHDPGDDLIAGSSLAHAEINALGKLRFRAHQEHELTLWTTLQPCIQCLGAIRLSAVRRVVVLAPDPLFRGVEAIRHVTPFLARSWPELTEREPDEWAALSLLFPTHLAAFWGAGVPDWDGVVRTVAALAAECVADGELVELAASGASVLDVARRLWPRLGAAVDDVRALAALGAP